MQYALGKVNANRSDDRQPANHAPESTNCLEKYNNLKAAQLCGFQVQMYFFYDKKIIEIQAIAIGATGSPVLPLRTCRNRARKRLKPGENCATPAIQKVPVTPPERIRYRL